ncbi:unnamed protein product, partial [Cylicostephanus goldi]
MSSSSRLDSDLTVCSFLEKLISIKTGDSGQAFEVDAKIRKQISNMIGVIADWESIQQKFVRDAVLCIYAISIVQRSLELDTSKNETVCALNLDVIPEAIPDCSVTEA